MSTGEDGGANDHNPGTDRQVVKKALVAYLGGARPRTVACLTGTWGCGKTHLWREIASELKLANKKTAYLSMFGIPSLASAKLAVFNAALLGTWGAEDPKENERLQKVIEWGSKAISSGVRAAEKALKLDFVEKYVDPSRFIREDTIVCLDDLERVSSEFRLEDVLGFANELAEVGGCRVLLIMNDDHLGSKYESEHVTLIRSYLERM